MKNGKILKIFTFTISIVLSLAFLVAPVNASLVFPDLTAEHWCYDKIIDFEEKGFVCGYEDGTFRPDQTITRAEYVKIVNNFFGYELEYDKDSGFSDINSGDWFIPYVNEAVERGYITGYEDGTFRPEDPIRRQEATVILARILDIDKEEYPADHVDGLAQYSDGDEVEEWAKVAIHSYSVYNFINGYQDGSLRILQDVTRAETVELLHILEQQIIIPEPDKDSNGGGGGGYSSSTARPVITAYEQINQELKVVPNGKWVNSETAYQDGSLIRITCQTNGATINYSLDNWKTQNEYTDEFVVLDGIHTINAYATKVGYLSSYVGKATVKVDTVPPKVQGVQNGKEVTLNVEDYDLHNIGTQNISGVSGDSLKYAWFTSGDQDYVRETSWITFENNGVVIAPEYPGVYYLGVMGSDVAGNKIGTGLFEKAPNNDDNVDFPNTTEDEEPTDEPFVIVTEIIKGDPTVEPPVEDKEEIIEITVNSFITIVHDFNDDAADLTPSGDIKVQIEAKPGEKYTVNALNSTEAGYEFVKNYDVKNAPQEITVSRNSGDASNTVTINYERIMVKVTFAKDDKDKEITGTMEALTNIPAGTTVTLTENAFQKVGHEFVEWSGSNGKDYDDKAEFTAMPENREVTLEAVWKVLQYEVKLISGDNVKEVNGAGKYDYGADVTIEAILDLEDGYTVKFVEWSGDTTSIKSFKNKEETSFKMPANDLLLEAIADKKANTNTKYTVKHWLETLTDDDYEVEETKTYEGTTDTDAVIKGKEKEFTGFTFNPSKTTTEPVNGDLNINGSGDLVINLYYDRNSYRLELKSGYNITAVSLNGTTDYSGDFKYGETVSISATLKTKNGTDYEFDEWTVKKADTKAEFTKPTKASQNITIPASNLTLTAEANEIDAAITKLEIVDFTGSGDKAAPEPGDTVTYEVTVENLSDESAKVKLKYSVQNSGDILGDKEEVITIPKGESKSFEFKAKINEKFDVNKEFVVEVEVKSTTGNNVTLASINKGKNTEKVATIKFKPKTNKNIVMLIDTSASMGFCTDHGITDYGYWGYVVLRENLVPGNEHYYSGNYETSEYLEEKDLVYNNGWLISDYNQKAQGPWKGHSEDLTSSGETNRCTAPSRIEVLINSLVAEETGFIDVIANAAENNSEENNPEKVTITLVTFSGTCGTTEPKPSISKILGPFDVVKEKTQLKQSVESLKYELHSGTYLNNGLKKVEDLVTSNQYEQKLLSDESVENYFIFFGDGDLSDKSAAEVEVRQGYINTLLKGNTAFFDYSYAIGFGGDFKPGSEAEAVLDSLLIKSADTPLKANSAQDITSAFASIARNILATTQTQNGKLKLSGTAFDDAVKNSRVFPIAVIAEVDGVTKVLFKITSTSDTSVSWDSDGDGIDDTTTNIEFNYAGSTLKEIVIDLSGTAFSTKKQLNVVLDKQ